MVWRVFEFSAGLLLGIITLRDVFETVVVPGGSRAALHVARRLSWLLLPVWKRMRGRRRGVSTAFAPLVLVLSFLIWMGLIATAFGAMAFAYRHSFTPPLRDLGESIYLVGTSMVTIGAQGIMIDGPARWISLGAGFCGLAVMTMAVTYLIQVQSSTAQRDSGILKLRTSAGDPPSAVALLEKYAVLGCASELPQVLRDGRDWCATVRQSHVSHPSLIYFRSIGTGAGWPAGLGALIDLALIVEELLDDSEMRGAAILLRQEAHRMAVELAKVVQLDPDPHEVPREEFEAAVRRLTDAGYSLLDPAGHQRFCKRRMTSTQWVHAMADHLGTPASPLIPERAEGISELEDT